MSALLSPSSISAVSSPAARRAKSAPTPTCVPPISEMPVPSEPALELNGVSVSYAGLRALHNVSMVVPQGAAVALLGANGAGKSTMLRTISGVIRAERGRIQVHGQRIERRPAYRIARMGVVHVPEGRGVFPSLTVRENLLMAISAMSGAVDPVEEGTALFPGPGDPGTQNPGTPSGGEGEVGAPGRGLMAKPKLLWGGKNRQ